MDACLCKQRCAGGGAGSGGDQDSSRGQGQDSGRGQDTGRGSGRGQDLVLRIRRARIQSRGRGGAMTRSWGAGAWQGFLRGGGRIRCEVGGGGRSMENFGPV